MQKLLVICGPTATGKTGLAMSLAGRLPMEIISSDSRQVFRGMDIGTGKDLPTDAVRRRQPLRVRSNGSLRTVFPYVSGNTTIWLVDVAQPTEEFTVSEYVKLAEAVVADVKKRGKLPVLVGGTGFFIHALLAGVQTFGIPPDPGLRRKLAGRPVAYLQRMLRTTYPDAWKSLNTSDRKNPVRLVRRFEVARAGRKRSGKLSSSAPERDVLTIGLTAPLPEIYRRIDERVEDRVHQGIEGEIKRLLDRGVSWEMQSMRSLGYREWKDWFDPNTERSPELRSETIRRWKYDEHAYARRQMTWFRKYAGAVWFDTTRKDVIRAIEDTVSKWYTQKES